MNTLNDAYWGIRHGHTSHWKRFEVFRHRTNESVGYIYGTSLARTQHQLNRIQRTSGELYVFLTYERPERIEPAPLSLHCRNTDCDFPAKVVSGWCEHHERIANGWGMSPGMLEIIGSGFRVRRIEPHISVIAKGPSGFGDDE